MTFLRITNWAASSAPSSAAPSLSPPKWHSFRPFRAAPAPVAPSRGPHPLGASAAPHPVQSLAPAPPLTEQILRLLIQISSFLTAWHLQTAASFKLFSFDGSGGSSDASAKLRPAAAAAFAIEAQ